MSGEAYRRIHGAWDIEDLSRVAYEYVMENDRLSEEEDASRMVERFEELGYHDMALKTDEFLRELVSTMHELQEELENLRPYWRALAWMDSGDSNEEVFHERMAKDGR